MNNNYNTSILFCKPTNNKIKSIKMIENLEKTKKIIFKVYPCILKHENMNIRQFDKDIRKKYHKIVTNKTRKVINKVYQLLLSCNGDVKEVSNYIDIFTEEELKIIYENKIFYRKDKEFTPEEDEYLLELISVYGLNFNKISQKFYNKSKADLKKRFQKIIVINNILPLEYFIENNAKNECDTIIIPQYNKSDINDDSYKNKRKNYEFNVISEAVYSKIGKEGKKILKLMMNFTNNEVLSNFLINNSIPIQNLSKESVYESIFYLFKKFLYNFDNNQEKNYMNNTLYDDTQKSKDRDLTNNIETFSLNFENDENSNDNSQFSYLKKKRYNENSKNSQIYDSSSNITNLIKKDRKVEQKSSLDEDNFLNITTDISKSEYISEYNQKLIDAMFKLYSNFIETNNHLEQLFTSLNESNIVNEKIKILKNELSNIVNIAYNIFNRNNINKQKNNIHNKNFNFDLYSLYKNQILFNNNTKPNIDCLYKKCDIIQIMLNIIKIQTVINYHLINFKDN